MTFLQAASNDSFIVNHVREQPQPKPEEDYRFDCYFPSSAVCNLSTEKSSLRLELHGPSQIMTLVTSKYFNSPSQAQEFLEGLKIVGGVNSDAASYKPMHVSLEGGGFQISLPSTFMFNVVISTVDPKQSLHSYLGKFGMSYAFWLVRK